MTMIEFTIEEYYHDLRQQVFASSEAQQDFLESEFLLNLVNELEGSGVIEGFEPCHYKAVKGMRVDGYWFREDAAALDLFVLDFENRETLESLTKTDVISAFKRLENFFTNTVDKGLFNNLEESSPGYGLSRDIFDRQTGFSKINFFLVSDRNLSERMQSLDDCNYAGWSFSYHVWDISRFYRQQTSRGAKEDLLVDFEEFISGGLQCLPAHLNNTDYESYLVVVPAEILSSLYGRYGTRLLEQNVRCFLQARGNVNKGIRSTIINDPGMFFAYNNGITATAKKIIAEKTQRGIFIKQISDLQIVNGGQTTASLFHTNRKDKASLVQVFVQMKLSIIDEEKSEEVVPKISEYANTQNKVNAADFFSNHPFHIRIEDFSRRLWAPPMQGELRESKWFYERARGQYIDEQTKLTQAGRKKFQAEHPKLKMFSKTDLAKFENVWDEKPTYVNLGAQKNFAKYAERIGKEWEKSPDVFNEFYYKRVIARAILFRRTEKLVSAQPWYQGGYRANIVAYTLAMLSEYCKDRNKSINYLQIWKTQEITPATSQALALTAKLVLEDISQPPAGISNISEWCKKDACWTRIKNRLPALKDLLPVNFIKELIAFEEIKKEVKTAKQTQKIDNGIQAQKSVMQYSGKQWGSILNSGKGKGIFTPKEVGILEVASCIPNKIPSEKQSYILLEILDKAYLEGLTIDNN